MQKKTSRSTTGCEASGSGCRFNRRAQYRYACGQSSNAAQPVEEVFDNSAADRARSQAPGGDSTRAQKKTATRVQWAAVSSLCRTSSSSALSSLRLESNLPRHGDDATADQITAIAPSVQSTDTTSSQGIDGCSSMRPSCAEIFAIATPWLRRRGWRRRTARQKEKAAPRAA
jgi:hypothetical protein